MFQFNENNKNEEKVLLKINGKLNVNLVCTQV